MPKKPYVKAPNAPKPQMGRILKDLFSNYKKRLTLVIFCIIISAVASTVSSLFMNQLISVIEKALKVYSAEGAAAAMEYAKPGITKVIGLMIAIYVIGILATTVYTLNMAVVTQGHLAKMREKMFKRMEKLPIKYFDQHPPRRYYEPLHQRYRHPAPAYLAGTAAGAHRRSYTAGTLFS